MRGTTGTLLLVVAAAVARAGDPPAPAADSMAAAKKDFASIKAAASPAEPGPGPTGVDMRDEGLPQGRVRTDAPALMSANGRSAADPSKKSGATGNWLVDAMERRADHPPSPPDGLDFLVGADKPDARAGSDARLAEAGERAAPRELAASVLNPLDAFMNGWISAHDRELLLPAARDDSLMGAGQGRAASGTLPGLDLGRSGVSAGGAPPSRDASLAESRSAANPYVTDLEPASVAPLRPLSVPDLPGLSPVGLPDLSPAASTPGAEPKFPDLSRSLAPDFTQPDDDDRYFRQLKRF